MRFYFPLELPVLVYSDDERALAELDLETDTPLDESDAETRCFYSVDSIHSHEDYPNTICMLYSAGEAYYIKMGVIKCLEAVNMHGEKYRS